MISFSKKCLKAKSTYILPLFLASNFYFFTEKKSIAKKTHSAIDNYKNELVSLDENAKKCFEQFNEEFLNLNKMMGESFFSYMFSPFYFFKISYVDLGKKWAFLSWNKKKVIPSYRCFSFKYDKKSWSLILKNNTDYSNELVNNVSNKLFLDFFILSLLFYKKSSKSNMFTFASSLHVLTNMFIKMFQSNRIYFLIKLFLLESADVINDLKNEVKRYQVNNLDLSDDQLELERKRLKENIFYQNLFVLPLLNQVAVAHYCFKNYPSHLICFPGFLSFSLINHIILGYFFSLVLKIL